MSIERCFFLKSVLILILFTTGTATRATAGEGASPEEIQIPSFKDLRPKWGVSLTSSLSALGGTNSPLIPTQTQQITGFSLGLHYLPPFVQRFGVLGLGPTVNVYPIFNSQITSSAISLLSVGGQIHYQARYFREQILVPTVSYDWEYLRYRFNTGQSNQLVISGPTLGAWLLLNFLEPSSTAEGYVSSKILRTYALVELRYRNGADGTVTVGGQSLYFGLRFEFL